jgi:Domain of unknown function (DUF5666)
MSRPLFFACMVACALTAGCDSTDSATPTQPSSTDRAQASITTRTRGVGSIQNGDFQVEGAITRLSGSCPLRSFLVRGTTVWTTIVTNIDDGCSDLENGVVVEVEGLRQRDGSVVASRIEREDEDDDEDDDDDDDDNDDRPRRSAR